MPNRQLENSHKRKEREKKTFKIRRKKFIALTIDNFLIKLTQFEKTGSRGKLFIPQAYLKIEFHCRSYNSITLFVTFTLSPLDSGVCFPCNKENVTELKENHKSNQTAKNQT